MKNFFKNNLEWFLGGAVFLFFAAYILFSSLSTSLDFKMESLSARQNKASEEHEELISRLARAQSKDSLLESGGALNLVEVVLADGYVDIRPQNLSAAGFLANFK